MVEAYLADRTVERVQVEEEVDAVVRKDFHTAIVICLWVDMVDTNCIGAQCLHECSVKRALLCVDERIIGNKLICHPYRPRSVALALARTRTEVTFDKELVAIAVEELAAGDV